MNSEPEYIRALSLLDALSKEAGIKLYVVGGYVRDLFLGNFSADKDIDVVVEGDAVAFAKGCLDTFKGALKTFASFGTAKIIKPQMFSAIQEIDFASSRQEIYLTPGALPTVSLAPLQKDLERRDFSVNAMALPVSALVQSLAGGKDEWKRAVIDIFHGQDDLKQGLIRVLHDKSFIDDPTRLYRAVRYKVRLQGEFESGTERLFHDALRSDASATCSIFRRYTEVRKFFYEKNWKQCLKEALDAGLLSFFDDDSIPSILEELFSVVQRDAHELFLQKILSGKSLEARVRFASAIQLSKKQLKALTESRA